MFRIIAIFALAVAAPAQTSPELAEQTRKLKALVASSPRLAVQKTEMPVQAPSAGWEMEMVSSVAVDAKGLVYAFQRGDKAQPVIAMDRAGRVLRSFGRGLYKIPHSIRIDPKGNVWTVDAASSMVYQHTPDGRKLLEIAVGGLPEKPRSAFCGTTDIAFASGGRIFISDGYANARVLEYNAAGKRVREWGKPGTGPGEFHLPHGIAVDERNILYVADRENGRIQRFDLNGKFLGAWDHLGKTFSITFRNGELWIGTQPRTSPNGMDGWMMKIDRNTGAILGYVETPGQHSVDLAGPGQPIAGARPRSVIWFRP